MLDRSSRAALGLGALLAVGGPAAAAAWGQVPDPATPTPVPLGRENPFEPLIKASPTPAPFTPGVVPILPLLPGVAPSVAPAWAYLGVAEGDGGGGRTAVVRVGGRVRFVQVGDRVGAATIASISATALEVDEGGRRRHIPRVRPGAPRP